MSEKFVNAAEQVARLMGEYSAGRPLPTHVLTVEQTKAFRDMGLLDHLEGPAGGPAVDSPHESSAKGPLAAPASVVAAVNASPPAEIAAEPWFAIRPPTPAELPSVYEAWAGTFKRSRSAGCIPNHLFNEVTFAAITQLLERGMRIAVLTARSHPDVVLAWIAYESDKRSAQVIVHYMFTKDGFRQRGLSKTLLAHIGAGEKFIYTHQTPFMKYWPAAYHNPGIARRKDL